ncbi:MAG: hypothetical protein JJT82_00275 [Legionellaceae bacterium]|nr:hypothetical protein [Legionellaceae bacterium]
MEFLLSLEFIIRLNRLRTDYCEKIGVSTLRDTPQPYAVRTFFGATDYQSRNTQICFLEALCLYLDVHCDLKGVKDPEDEPHLSIEALLLRDNRRLNALRTLTSACLFIKAQNSSGSRLNQLIVKALGIRENNTLDLETRANCYRSAQKFLQDQERFDKINACLKAQQKEPLSIDVFRDWSTYVAEQMAKKKYSDYPLTNIMIPLIANPMRVAGTAFGVVTAKLLTRSTSLLRANLHVTAALGGGMYMMMGSRAATGVFFMAPTLAKDFMEYYLTISLAWLCGHSAGLLGNTLAYGIGLPLDCGWKMVVGSSRYAYRSIYGEPLADAASGMSLLSGNLVMKGVVICAKAKTEFSGMQELPWELELEPANPITATQQTSPPSQTPLPYLQELKERVSPM